MSATAQHRYTMPTPSILTHQQQQQQYSSEAIASVQLSEYQRIRNSFGAGAVALASSFAVMHPLDTLKTRMQAAAGSGRNTNMKGLFNVETMRVLRRGFLASVLGAGPQGGLRWATYEVCKSHITSASSASTANTSLLPSFGFMATSAISAIAGDFVSSIVKVPREVITARLQTGHYDKSSQGRATAIYAFRMILKEEGPAGLFRGFWSTTARDWPFMAILFTTYDTLKQFHHRLSLPSSSSSSVPPTYMLDPMEPQEVSITTVKSTLFGGVAGALAAFLTTPFDVIRTKIMTRADHSKVTMGQIAREIVGDQRRVLVEQGRVVGPRVYTAFFTGGLARSTWWFCVCSMFFPIYERMKEVFDDMSA
ncbi:uncharacterized protein SPPG_02365 [Spizellomyces punctatus DAOM BR117]|uniref:Mitochondrial carrier protein n=1 Tax=Spizellomyces punctatus (strain DAOM BR117) TaxID=645134 RepID=A0A0L0HR34_SPIPD|nr:uncharacterized protein SPPG_02365 [Spizellomyces punctatus DAOM BR117]KND03319.1 hypothetical protein SPPG_02365 [Spizellomyces punctatus DAOM BR117]|eukprot:XP_016611358.1 hypothetical protein SPPG_02365 [Spizellomyces punctatus DAOM BR117]